MFRTWTNLSIGLGLLLVTGCRQEMAHQPSYRPLRPSAFFENGMSARPLVKGTVARGQLQDDMHLYEGKWPATIQYGLQAAGIIGGAAGDPYAAMIGGFERPLYADAFPFPITRKELERGQERYNIYCAVCHDRAGAGRGMIVQRGFTQPPSYHTDLSRGLQLRGIRQKLSDAPVGYYFEVITRGFGAMPDYAEQVSAQDRWAIIAYIRALQLSQQATLADVHDETAKQKLLRGLP
jgi:mono/diheme cytochrome c family protein